LEYDGNRRKIIAKNNVIFKNNNTTLKTQILFHDRDLKEIYFEKGGVIKDSSNTIKSTEGKYYLENSKYEFNKRVNVYNNDTDIKSFKLDYYSDTEKVFFYGPTVITGQDYRIFSEKGFYNTKTKNGFFNTKAKIEYSNRTITGDSLIFDDLKKYASGKNNVTILDTINKTIIKGNFAEIFKELDSAMITRNSYAIKLLKIYIQLTGF
jgi:hypothetical protein